MTLYQQFALEKEVVFSYCLREFTSDTYVL